MSRSRQATPRARVAGVLALSLGLAVAAAGDKPAELPKPRSYPNKQASAQGPDVLPTSAVHGLEPAVPVCLYDVLRLASVANLDVAQANLVVERARAAVLGAKSLYLP